MSTAFLIYVQRACSPHYIEVLRNYVEADVQSSTFILQRYLSSFHFSFSDLSSYFRVKTSFIRGPPRASRLWTPWLWGHFLAGSRVTKTGLESCTGGEIHAHLSVSSTKRRIIFLCREPTLISQFMIKLKIQNSEGNTSSFTKTTSTAF